MKKEIILQKEMILKLRKLKVAAIYLFGSIAEGLDSRVSDIDLGILMDNGSLVSENVSTLELYQKLYDIFSPLESLSGRKIDIVLLQRASLELRVNAIRCGKIIYEGNPIIRADFEDYTMILFADFLPLSYQFDQAILAKI